MPFFPCEETGILRDKINIVNITIYIFVNPIFLKNKNE